MRKCVEHATPFWSPHGTVLVHAHCDHARSEPPCPMDPPAMNQLPPTSHPCHNACCAGAGGRPWLACSALPLPPYPLLGLAFRGPSWRERLVDELGYFTHRRPQQIAVAPAHVAHLHVGQVLTGHVDTDLVLAAVDARPRSSLRPRGAGSAEDEAHARLPPAVESEDAHSCSACDRHASASPQMCVEAHQWVATRPRPGFVFCAARSRARSRAEARAPTRSRLVAYGIQ